MFVYLLRFIINTLLYAEGPPFTVCPQEGYKLDGYDTRTTESVSSWEACSELCRRRRDCRFWSYDTTNLQCVSITDNTMPMSAKLPFKLLVHAFGMDNLSYLIFYFR